MQGRVFQRTRGRGKPWSYAVDLPPHPDGRRRQRLKGGFRTKDEAQQALTRTLADAQKGVVADPSRITLGEHLEDWLSSVSRSLKPTTWEGYAHAARVWIIPRIGGSRLTAVTPELLENLYATLETEGRQDGAGGLGSRAVRLAHQVLRLALAQAARRQRIPTNPADAGLHLPRQTRKPFRTWTEVEARRFLQSVADDRLAALWTLVVATGMRRGEAIGLRWEDVDLGAGRLSVVQHVVVAENRPLVQEIKTPASRRSIVLYPDVVAALRRHAVAQQAERQAIGPAWENSGLVFTTVAGGVLHPRNVLRSFDRLVERAAVPDITIHDLRHTAATLALRAGVHPKLVQEMLGHARVAITLDLYSHVVEEMHHDASDRLGRLLFPREPVGEDPVQGTGSSGMARVPSRRERDHVGMVNRTRGVQLGPEARPVAVPDDVGDVGVDKARGRVELPLHVRWSGPPKVYDLRVPADRLRVYEQVLREGTEDDVRRYIDVDQLLKLWDELVLPGHVRRAWAAWFREQRGIDVAC